MAPEMASYSEHPMVPSMGTGMVPRMASCLELWMEEQMVQRLRMASPMGSWKAPETASYSEHPFVSSMGFGK